MKEYTQPCQVGELGQFLITVFLLIFLSFVFGGFFTPEPAEDPRDRPKGYVPYDRRDDY